MAEKIKRTRAQRHSYGGRFLHTDGPATEREVLRRERRNRRRRNMAGMVHAHLGVSRSEMGWRKNHGCAYNPSK
jgi:hypothetical protein